MSYPPGPPYEGSPEWQGQQPEWQGQPQPPEWQGQPQPGWQQPQQPGGWPGQQPAGWPGQQEPDNYLVWAILCTVLCCLPFGIVSLVYSNKVSGLWAQGRVAEAQEASSNAKKWAIIGAIAGAVTYAIIVILYIVIAVVAVSSIPSTTSTTFSGY
ncbi:hypothetical protein A5647_02415 [Mycobacterium sp. 1100029.7]|nr:hypothetical protein A5647_02415 [Mycobacterium sp. 1100029.7]